MMISAHQASAASSHGGNSNNKETKRLHITHVDAFGPYLRIFGNLNPDAMAVVRSVNLQVLSSCFAIDPNWTLDRQRGPLRVGRMCLYKRSNGAAPSDCEFLRACILSVLTPQPNAQGQKASMLQVMVEFVDYGETALVASYELLFPQQEESLLSTPIMCSQYILLGICKDFKEDELNEIAHIVKRQTLEITIELEFKQFKFITMKWKQFNFAEFLIHQKKIGAPIPNDLLRDNFVKFIKQQQPQPQTQPQPQQQKLYVATNNVNIIANKGSNNNNYYGSNNNATIDVVGNKAAGGDFIYAGRGLSSQQELAMRRTVTARLHQFQSQQMPYVLPRMPHTIGNLRSMMQGIHIQNNRIPFTGTTYQQAPVANAFNGGLAAGMLSMTPAPQFSGANMYHTRYQRPQPPPQSVISAIDPVGVVSIGTNTSMVTTSSGRRINPGTFKSNSLNMGKSYEVCVSFVENGPCLFSVQLANAQQELTNMMNKIERMPLKQFVEKPVLGTACIARYSEDGQLYRALITGVQPTACKVAYIDYGNAELVKFRDLYEIPDEFLEAKAFAIRFTLAGNKELEPIDESLKKAFKDLVIYQNCKLKVVPLEGPPLVQYCELYMQDSNIMDVLKQIQKCRLVYPKAEALHNNDIVEIRYIDSPKHFYVQKISNIAKFEELMDDMFLHYNKNQVVPNHLSLGAPCIVKYDIDWYRAEVMRFDATAIIVRHVDFGYEQKVTKNLLSTVAEKHLKLPRQAVQCCLKGFENNELSKDLATNQFEMLAEESNRTRRSFTVKVFRIHPDGVHLVNLCTKDLNVMKKLYKLSMPFEQYLTLEKEEFNVHTPNGHQKNNSNAENGYKTPSITSSNDAASSMHSGKKANGNLVNSTMLHNNERSPPLQQQQSGHQKQVQQSRTPQQRHNKSSISNSEWDKQSSASSMDNRDSRSNSSEHQRAQQGKRQQMPQKRGRNLQQQLHNISIASSSDRRSNGSGSGSAYSKARQNNKQDNENRRSNKQTNQRPQRSQNAPQGYSQQRQKQIMAATSSNRSNDAASTCTQDELSSGSELPLAASEEYVPLGHAFPTHHIDMPKRADVIICWWVSPHQFYTQLKSRIPEFEALMLQMQQFYKKKSLQHLPLKVGSYVVARYRKENAVYRARILACNQMLRKYKVHFVDFGNQYTVTSEDIWQVEKRFAEFPCMAHLCSFSGIVSNYDHLHIIDRMEKYLPSGATLKCDYIEAEQQMYYVNVTVNGVSLMETLKKDKIITEVTPDLRLGLLAGQQIRAKISSIKDMLNFKIQIDGLPENVQLLCSYDDLRYVKSNPDIAQKFKQFYEEKSCVVNIKDVNDNKVILLRPLLPLLKEDIPTYICSYPIVLEKFAVRVVYVASAYRLYAQTIATEMEVASLIDDMYAFYEKEGAALREYGLEQICAAKSSDGNWYRARIAANAGPASVEVYYVDYGNKETIEKKQLKQLAEQFYVNKSALAVEINLPLRTLNDQQQQHKYKSKSKSNSEAATSAVSDLNVIDKIKALTLEKVLTVKSLEVRHNHLMADLEMPEGKSLVQLLLDEKLIRSRDEEYMRKLLDKDKTSSMIEYIETVDLTLEDEDEIDRRQVNKNKAVPQSPKKKENKKSAKTADVLNESSDAASVKLPEKATVEVVLKTEEPQVAVKELPVAAKELEVVEAEATKPSTVAVITAAVTPPPAEPEPIIDPYADMELAVLSHCDNPAQFFVHPYDKLDELHKLQENLQIVASSLPPLMRVINGAHCISLYSVDKQWYRAKIIDAELMVLQFIDFGNTDCVTDTTDVKEMSVFPDIEPLCMPCALPIKPNGTHDWADAANAIFNDSYTKMLHFEYITHGAETQQRSFIKLFIEGVNVTQKLLDDGFAKPLQLVESGENCYISHVNGIGDFFIQYEKESKALELIEIYLSDMDKLKKLDKFENAKIVAALFPDDEMWYRAKLLREVPNKGYEVLFIDYGNTSISPECREISEEIAELPPLSKRCALQLPTSCLGWSDAAEEKFAEIAAQGETIFTVELREPAAEHAIVHLLIDGNNINDELESLCPRKPVESELNISFGNSTMQTSVYESGQLYDAIISHANSPSEFYVQLSKNAIRLEDMTSSLNSLAMEKYVLPEVGQLCAALYLEDKSLYRARILEIVPKASVADTQQYRVLFIDFGNEALTTDVRTLPQDLLQLKAFCKRCKLENADQFATISEAASQAAFNTLIDACEGIVKIDVLEEQPDEPTVVRLFAGEDNLGLGLSELLGLNEEPKTENALHTIRNTNAMLPANSCLISHAVSPSLFYIQPGVNSAKMEVVTKALQKCSAELLPPLNNPEVGIVCCAYAPEDDCYYRGRVERVLVDGDTSCIRYVIFLLDYGNTTTSTQLRELSEELRAIPALAQKCKLNAIPQASETILEERFGVLLEAHFGEFYEIVEDVLDAETRVHAVKLQINYKDLGEQLAQAVAVDATQVDALAAVMPTLHECSIIHVNSASSFYIQLTTDVAAVEKITDVLLDAEQNFEPFTQPEVGAICAAQFPDDLAYYRAQIVRLLDEGKCEVHYLDFGNNSVTDQFRQLPEDMRLVAGYSKHCALDGNFNNVKSAQFKTFVDSRFSETFQVEFLKIDEELNICRLFYQNKDVASELPELLKSVVANEANEGLSSGEETSATDAV